MNKIGLERKGRKLKCMSERMKLKKHTHTNVIYHVQSIDHAQHFLEWECETEKEKYSCKYVYNSYLQV